MYDSAQYKTLQVSTSMGSNFEPNKKKHVIKPITNLN